jgi:hypothetical protein
MGFNSTFKGLNETSKFQLVCFVNPVLNYILQVFVNRTAIPGENKVCKTNTEITSQIYKKKSDQRLLIYNILKDRKQGKLLQE